MKNNKKDAITFAMGVLTGLFMVAVMVVCVSVYLVNMTKAQAANDTAAPSTFTVEDGETHPYIDRYYGIISVKDYTACLYDGHDLGIDAKQEIVDLEDSALYWSYKVTLDRNTYYVPVLADHHGDGFSATMGVMADEHLIWMMQDGSVNEYQCVSITYCVRTEHGIFTDESMTRTPFSTGADLYTQTCANNDGSVVAIGAWKLVK